MIRIWHLSSNRWNSAITEYALSACRALMAKGYSCTFSPLTGSPAHVRAEGLGLSIEALPRFGLRQLSTLQTLQSRIKADVVMVYGGPETFLTKGISLGAKRPRFLRFRGQDIESQGATKALLQRQAHAHIDTIFSPALYLSDKLRRVMSRSIATVPLGCDDKKFRFLARGRPETGRPTVVILGRLDPVKGHVPAMQMFVSLLELWQQGPRPLLKIVGEPANLSVAHLQSEAKRLGLASSDICFVPTRVDDIETILNDAHVGWIPSIGSEVIGRVAEEFLLSGTPIAVSGVGSLSEVLFADAGIDYSTIESARQASALCDLLKKSVKESEAQRSDRAEEAKKRFSLKAMGDRLDELVSIQK